VCVCVCVWAVAAGIECGVARTSRLLKIKDLFRKRALQKRGYSAKETYDFKEPTSRPLLLLI